jgi:hypothetical protein
MNIYALNLFCVSDSLYLSVILIAHSISDEELACGLPISLSVVTETLLRVGAGVAQSVQ